MPNATVRANARALPDATDHPADKAQTVGPNHEGYRHRYFEIDEPLHNAVVWASFLDVIVEDMERLPSMSRRELNVAYGKLIRVVDPLQQAINDLDAIYHKREKEEARA
jgi:hypothetical protein